jgi:hypothetical protein
MPDPKNARIRIEGAGLPASKEPAIALPAGVLPEGLEINPSWSIAAWGNPGALSRTQLESIGGSGTGLQIVLSKAEKDKLAATLPFANLSVKGNQSVEMNAYTDNSGRTSIAIAIGSGENSIWYESEPVVLRDGWNQHLSFDLKKPVWKSAESNWIYNQTIPDGAVKQLVLLVYQASPGQKIVFDSIRLR